MTHGWSPERLSLACGSGSMTPIGGTKEGDGSGLNVPPVTE